MMDRFFKAAVCDLDKLLDDFEQNTEDVDCKTGTWTLPATVCPGASLSASASFGTAGLTSESEDTEVAPVVSTLYESFSPKDIEVTKRPLTGVDLLSSVDNRTSKSTAPPCPDRALKPVCDLVSDTGSATLLRTDSHDAFKELDIAEKQLEEEMLVDFECPMISLAQSMLPLDTGKIKQEVSPYPGDFLAPDSQTCLFTGARPASVSLLDIILPASLETGTELHNAMSPSSSETLEFVESSDSTAALNENQNDRHQNVNGGSELSQNVQKENTDGPVFESNKDGVEERQGLDCAESSELDKPEDWNGNQVGQEPECAGWSDSLDSQVSNSPRQESSLSCLPMAMSMCGSLVASLETQEQVQTNVQDVEENEVVLSDSQVTEAPSVPEVQKFSLLNVDIIDVDNNMSPDTTPNGSVSQCNVTSFSEMETFHHMNKTYECTDTSEATASSDVCQDSGNFVQENLPSLVGESLVAPSDYAFVQNFLPECDQSGMLVTDEELDAFLMGQGDTDPLETHLDEFSSGSIAEPNVYPAESHDLSQDDFQDQKFENSQDDMHDPASSDNNQLPQAKEECNDSSPSSQSQDSSLCSTDIKDGYESEEPTHAAVGPPIHTANQQHYFGGARPKQLYGQHPKILLTCEIDGHISEDKDDFNPGESVVSSSHLCSGSSVGQVPSHCAMSSVCPYQDGFENSVDCDELSEPPSFLEGNTVGGADPVTDDGLLREPSGLGLRQPPWIPDSEAPNCMKCLQKFTFTKRRHHCRACGKVFCAMCCSKKCKLKYLDKEARVCLDCHDKINRTQALERMMSPTGPGPSPNPNIPSEYCSTIPPLQQARAAGTLNSPPPTVMVPVSVLKQPGTEGFPREQRRVWFADGILPNGEVADTSRLTSKKTSPESSPAGSDSPVIDSSGIPVACLPAQNCETEVVSNLDGILGNAPMVPEELDVAGHPPLAGPYDFSLLCHVGELVGRSTSLVPEDEEGLPPLLIFTGEDSGADVMVEERPAPSQIMLLLEEGGPQPLTFVLNVNLLVNVKLVTCSSKKCWCFGSSGLQALGQKEVVFVLQCLPEESTLPKDMFKLYLSMYQDAEKGKFVEDLGNVTFTESFLGSRDHGGFLFFLPTFQPMEGLLVPTAPFLCGVLIQKLEVPWAKVFPLRLLLRLGAEHNVYPSSPVSERFRKAVFRETGHTIMNLLTDLRNYQYTLPMVEGLRIHMEMGNSYIDIPKCKFNEMLKVVNTSNEHVISMGASFSTEADSHLVCFQNEEGTYQTQASSKPGHTRRVTGASFVIFNGALKASSGFIAKSSIVEDGLMVQIPPDTMEGLRQSVRDQGDFQIPCGKADADELRENVSVRWVDWTPTSNTGERSPIDGRSLDVVPSIRLQQDAEFEMVGRTVKCVKVFYLLKTGDVHLTPSLPSQFLREISTASCAALCPHLAVLTASGINHLGLRITADADVVEYQAGSQGRLLPQQYMNELDSALIPVIHGGSSGVPQHPMDIEFIFYITQKLC